MEPKTAQEAIEMGKTWPPEPIRAALDEMVAISQAGGEYEQPAPPPISEIDQQLLKLRVSLDELNKMVETTEQTITGLMQAKREGIVAQVAALEQELADIDDEIGSGPRRTRKHAGGNVYGLHGSPSSHDLANWLKNHADKEWSAREIGDAIGLGAKARKNVASLLRRYLQRGEVRKRGVGHGQVRFTWVGGQ